MSDPTLIVSIEELLTGENWRGIDDDVRAMVEPYRAALTPERRDLLDQYQLVHLAPKVVGAGSVGTRAWIALFIGRDERDPLILQIKEATESVLEHYAGESEYDHSGERVVAGQRR